MEKLRRRLPPLNGLVVFEAAARLLSFTAAAHEICITQAAVSRQIRLVEEFLGHELFVREHRRVSLTPSGRRLYAAVDQGMERIAQAAGDIRSGTQEALTITATIGLSTYWLMPHLEAFQAEHPEVAIRLLALDREVDLREEQIDVAFTCGDEGQSQHIRMTRLFDENMVPLCSPGYLAGRQIKNLQQLVGERLLHLDHEHWRGFNWPVVDWSTWLNQMGYEGPLPPSRMAYNNYAQQIQATLDGRGIGLACIGMLKTYLDSGQLVQPLALEHRTARGYYMAVNQASTNEAALQVFLGWWERSVVI
ncbi:LysR substrate-binding domain-containing protein [Pseudomonas sp. Pdm06]|uniref:LysR substrate-binding domain-containing protein n=1 Tax=Pseudomonas sp. Pdm06 TaxID=1790044 RepID=UPI0017872E4A|nr:LysR substrate-binding domain-containing protein [Pseudomonas sp. Pdm06]MBD9466347.1 LysR family transcriptional regulator [Pseudomonas sp. Pdm06]